MPQHYPPLSVHQKTIMMAAIGHLPSMLFSPKPSEGETTGSLAQLPVELGDTILAEVRNYAISSVRVYYESIDSSNKRYFAYLDSGGTLRPVNSEAAWPPTERVLKLLDEQTKPFAQTPQRIKASQSILSDRNTGALSLFSTLISAFGMWHSAGASKGWSLFFLLILLLNLSGSMYLLKHLHARRSHHKKRIKTLEALKAEGPAVYAQVAHADKVSTFPRLA